MEAKEREEDEVFVWPQVRCEGHTGLSTLISEWTHESHVLWGLSDQEAVHGTWTQWQRAETGL